MLIVLNSQNRPKLEDQSTDHKDTATAFGEFNPFYVVASVSMIPNINIMTL
jgi:hypothetical protein